jgi:hypothetical protein
LRKYKFMHSSKKNGNKKLLGILRHRLEENSKIFCKAARWVSGPDSFGSGQ